MDKHADSERPNRREQALQHTFLHSETGIHKAAQLGGAAISIDAGEYAIGAQYPRPAIDPETNPKLYKAYQQWLALRVNG